MKTILLCMGTRPEIIKMAPVYYALRDSGFEPLLLHTGQHQDMADPMYEFFNMTPDFSLDLPRSKEDLYHLSAQLLERLGAAFSTVRPSAVLVHGDTASATMAAMAAYYQKIPVGHVEAGLRSHRDYDPFPEEKNREIIGCLAQWHFAPTEKARDNLLKENVPASKIHLVGNTIVDAVRIATSELGANVDGADELKRGPLKTLNTRLRGRKLVFVTAHRRENLGKPLLSITRAVRDLLEAQKDLVVVWPVHSNPKIRATVDEVFRDLPEATARRLYLTRPLTYSTTISLLRRAWLVLTDSGGIQEEAACMNLPVLIMRETTERPELVECGGGRLIGTEREAIVQAVNDLLDNDSLHVSMSSAPNPFGDGYAASRIHEILTRSNYVN